MDEPNSLYTRIDAALQSVLDETDAILGGTEDRLKREAIAWEIWSRVCKTLREVNDRGITCAHDLEAHP